VVRTNTRIISKNHARNHRRRPSLQELA
jgi:hypothetical protein